MPLTQTSTATIESPTLAPPKYQEVHIARSPVGPVPVGLCGKSAKKPMGTYPPTATKCASCVVCIDLWEAGER